MYSIYTTCYITLHAIEWGYFCFWKMDNRSTWLVDFWSKTMITKKLDFGQFFLVISALAKAKTTEAGYRHAQQGGGAHLLTARRPARPTSGGSQQPRGGGFGGLMLSLWPFSFVQPKYLFPSPLNLFYLVSGIGGLGVAVGDQAHARKISSIKVQKPVLTGTGSIVTRQKKAPEISSYKCSNNPRSGERGRRTEKKYLSLYLQYSPGAVSRTLVFSTFSISAFVLLQGIPK
jgi:hypothetical protein